MLGRPSIPQIWNLWYAGLAGPTLACPAYHKNLPSIPQNDGYVYIAVLENPHCQDGGHNLYPPRALAVRAQTREIPSVFKENAVGLLHVHMPVCVCRFLSNCAATIQGYTMASPLARGGRALSTALLESPFTMVSGACSLMMSD